MAHMRPRHVLMQCGALRMRAWPQLYSFSAWGCQRPYIRAGERSAFDKRRMCSRSGPPSKTRIREVGLTPANTEWKPSIRLGSGDRQARKSKRDTRVSDRIQRQPKDFDRSVLHLDTRDEQKFRNATLHNPQTNNQRTRKSPGSQSLDEGDKKQGKRSAVSPELINAIEEILWEPNDKMRMDLRKYCMKLDIPVFRNTRLLLKAVTSPSFCSRVTGKELNEPRVLEWLGDRLLKLFVSAYYFHEYRICMQKNEAFRCPVSAGDLLDYGVENYKLAECASHLDLERILRLDENMISNVKKNTTARPYLADALESLIGAIYLEHGLAVCDKFLKKALRWKGEREFSVESLKRSWKDELILQVRFWVRERFTLPSIEYRVLPKEIPPPAILAQIVTPSLTVAENPKLMCVGVFIHDKCIARGYGASCSAAEDHAAQTATMYLGRENTGTRAGTLRGVGNAWASLQVISQLMRTDVPFASIQDASNEGKQLWEVRITFGEGKELQHHAYDCSKTEAMDLAAQQAIALLNSDRIRAQKIAKRAIESGTHTPSLAPLTRVAYFKEASKNEERTVFIHRATLERWLDTVEDIEHVKSKLNQILFEWDSLMRANNNATDSEPSKSRLVHKSFVRDLLKQVGSSLEEVVTGNDLILHFGLKIPILELIARFRRSVTLDRRVRRAEKVGFFIQTDVSGGKGDPGVSANAIAIRTSYCVFLSLIYLHCGDSVAFRIIRRFRRSSIDDVLQKNRHDELEEELLSRDLESEVVTDDE